MKSDDIKELVAEMKLISSEITESRIQEEMTSDDFSTDNSKPYFVEQDSSMKSPQQNLKSDEITNSNNSSSVKSNDFTGVSREIIDAKNEVINTLKGSLQSKEVDAAQLREVISDLTQQLKTTTRQNAWLTNLLVAPKTEPEPMRKATVTDITEESDEITPDADTTGEAKAEQNTPTEERAEDDLPEDVVPDPQAEMAL